MSRVPAQAVSTMVSFTACIRGCPGRTETALTYPWEATTVSWRHPRSGGRKELHLITDQIDQNLLLALSLVVPGHASLGFGAFWIIGSSL